MWVWYTCKIGSKRSVKRWCTGAWMKIAPEDENWQQEEKLAYLRRVVAVRREPRNMKQWKHLSKWALPPWNCGLGNAAVCAHCSTNSRVNWTWEAKDCHTKVKNIAQDSPTIPNTRRLCRITELNLDTCSENNQILLLGAGLSCTFFQNLKELTQSVTTIRWRQIRSWLCACDGSSHILFPSCKWVVRATEENISQLHHIHSCTVCRKPSEGWAKAVFDLPRKSSNELPLWRWSIFVVHFKFALKSAKYFCWMTIAPSKPFFQCICAFLRRVVAELLQKTFEN